MDKDGFVRASYMQLGAESGRMSCVKPNNQQIPRDPQFRGVLKRLRDTYCRCRLRANGTPACRLCGKDARMIQAFQDGEDPHTVTESIGCDRQTAKSANFDFYMEQVLPV